MILINKDNTSSHSRKQHSQVCRSSIFHQRWHCPIVLWNSGRIQVFASSCRPLSSMRCTVLMNGVKSSDHSTESWVGYVIIQAKIYHSLPALQHALQKYSTSSGSHLDLATGLSGALMLVVGGQTCSSLPGPLKTRTGFLLHWHGEGLALNLVSALDWKLL